MTGQETEPREIELEGPREPLKIVWEDGHRSVYELEYLRRWCPCAQCTEHGATPLVERMTRRLPPRATEVKAVQEIGNYALQLTWGDGHDTGLYSFTHLRDICACPACKPSQTLDV